MFIYSAIKINTKGPLLYSVLKPETSSDSPSAKSKGVRFVSAKAVMNQINRVIGTSKAKGVFIVEEIFRKFMELATIRGVSKTKIILTS